MSKKQRLLLAMREAKPGLAPSEGPVLEVAA